MRGFPGDRILIIMVVTLKTERKYRKLILRSFLKRKTNKQKTNKQTKENKQSKSTPGITIYVVCILSTFLPFITIGPFTQISPSWFGPRISPVSGLMTCTNSIKILCYISNVKVSFIQHNLRDVTCC